MSSIDIREHAVELAWSLWTELGVPGVNRNHHHTVIDPEPLILATPILAAGDPRLLEQVFGWCATHSDRISTSRIRGLLSGASEQVVSRFSSLSSTLRIHGVKWPSSGQPTPWPVPTQPPTPPLPLKRPALLRFRVRALCGVGARSDILCDLLATPEAWWSAAELARLGYTKRNIAKVLSDLDGAGIVVRREDGNTLRFRLAGTSSLREMLNADDLAAPSWQPILALFLELLGLLDHATATATVRRVEASTLRERLVQPCHLLDLEPPPPTRGVPDAWDEMLRWASRQTGLIAAGQ